MLRRRKRKFREDRECLGKFIAEASAYSIDVISDEGRRVTDYISEQLPCTAIHRACRRMDRRYHHPFRTVSDEYQIACAHSQEHVCLHRRDGGHSSRDGPREEEIVITDQQDHVVIL